MNIYTLEQCGLGFTVSIEALFSSEENAIQYIKDYSKDTNDEIDDYIYWWCIDLFIVDSTYEDSVYRFKDVHPINRYSKEGKFIPPGELPYTKKQYDDYMRADLP